MKKVFSGKKWIVIILTASIIAGILCALYAFGIIKLKSSREKAFLSNIPDSWAIDKDNIEFHENGNIIYKPGMDSIKVDDTNTVIYYDNLIIAYLSEELTEEDAKGLAESIDGVLVGYVTGAISTVQIATNGLSFKEITDKVDLLCGDSRVSYATYEAPVSMDFSDYWNGETDLGNESAPSGYDWWAESIGAYSAWQYESLSDPICVGIVDNGVEISHEDFFKDEGNVCKSVISMKNENSKEEHGTHVAGLICAQPNSIGIKGIANNADIMCIDAADSDDERNLNLLGFSFLIEWYNELIGSASDKNLPIVINNSWGSSVSERKDDFWGEHFGFKASEEEIKARYKNSFREDTYQCIWIIYSLLEHGYDDFMFVQSAGNGYTDSKIGYDISDELGSDFCGISETTFSEMKKLRPESPLKNYSFQDIIDHVVIVAAYENTYEGSSNRLTSFSNYGNTISIAAPGKDIYSTVLDNKYDLMNGTSMAAPIVTGSLAYLWSLDHSLSAGEVKDILINQNGGKTAVGVTKDDTGRYYPALNIGASVNYIVKKNNVAPEDLSASDTDIAEYGTCPENKYYENKNDLAISEDCLSALGDSYQNLKNKYGGRFERDTGSTPKMLVETEKNWIFMFKDYAEDINDLSYQWEECGDDICWLVEGTAESILGITEPVVMSDIMDTISVSPIFEKSGEASFGGGLYSDHGSDPVNAFYITIPVTRGYLEIRSVGEMDLISPDSKISVRKPDITGNENASPDTDGYFENNSGDMSKLFPDAEEYVDIVMGKWNDGVQKKVCTLKVPTNYTVAVDQLADSDAIGSWKHFKASSIDEILSDAAFESDDLITFSITITNLEDIYYEFFIDDTSREIIEDKKYSPDGIKIYTENGDCVFVEDIDSPDAYYYLKDGYKLCVYTTDIVYKGKMSLEEFGQEFSKLVTPIE